MAHYSKGRSFALTPEQRQAVRKMFETLPRTQENYQQVAKFYKGVGPGTIARYVRGR